MQAKLRYITLFLFLFFNTADAQMPVRPLEPAFKAMENEDWDKAFLLADKDGDLGYSIILWHYLREGLGRPDEALRFLEQNPDWPGLPYLRKRSEKTFLKTLLIFSVINSLIFCKYLLILTSQIYKLI